MEKESLGKMMLKSSSVIFFALIITRLFGFLFNSLLTKNITTEEYGSYTFALSISQMGVGIFLLGIPAATAYYIAYNRGRQDQENIKAYTKTGFITDIILVMISVLGIITINRFFPDIFSLSRELMLFMLLMFIIQGTGFFFSFVVSGHRKPEISILFAASAPVLSYLSLIILTQSGFGFYHILIGIAVSYAIQFILCIAYVLKNYGFGGKVQPRLIKNLIKFGIPLILTDVSSGLLWWTGIYVIKYYDNFADVGIFWAASMISSIMLMFPQAMLSIYSPVVSELFGKGDKEKIQYISSYIIERLLLMSLPLIAILLLFPEGILKIVFTADYSTGALSMQILALSAFFTGIYLFFGTVITTSGHPQQNSKLMFLGAASNVIFSIILVRYLGIAGASLAYLISSGIILTISFRWARKIVKIVFYRDRLLKILTALVSVLPFIYAIKVIFSDLFLAFVLSLVLLPVIYFITLMILRTFREEDIFLVKNALGGTKLSASIINILKNGIS